MFWSQSFELSEMHINALRFRVRRLSSVLRETTNPEQTGHLAVNKAVLQAAVLRQLSSPGGSPVGAALHDHGLILGGFFAAVALPPVSAAHAQSCGQLICWHMYRSCIPHVKHFCCTCFSANLRCAGCFLVDSLSATNTGSCPEEVPVLRSLALCKPKVSIGLLKVRAWQEMFNAAMRRL